jgi:hypothetical protein
MDNSSYVTITKSLAAILTNRLTNTTTPNALARSINLLMKIQISIIISKTIYYKQDDLLQINNFARLTNNLNFKLNINKYNKSKRINFH